MDRYDYLYHHGILGQKWGVRRFQNKNGTLTSAGKKRYGIKITRKEEKKTPWDEKPSKNQAWDEKVPKIGQRDKRPSIFGTKSMTNKSQDEKSRPWDEKSSTRQPWNEKPNNKIKKRVAASVVVGATVAAAAVYVHKNSDAIGKVVSKFKNMKMSDVNKSVSEKGKEYVKQALAGIKEGAHEAAKEAPKKATKAVITGGVMLGTKKVLDSVAGKDTSAKIFQANDNKKIGKFWKVSPEDSDDKDD